MQRDRLPSRWPLTTARCRHVARRGTGLLGGVAGLVLAGVLLRAALGPLQAWDARVVADIARTRPAPLISASHALSYLGRAWILIPLGAFADVAITHGASRRWSTTVGVVTADVVQNATKAIVGRPRPPVRHLEHVTSSSFPSGHATQITAFVLCVITLLPLTSRHTWRRVVIVVLGASLVFAVAMSRLYLGVHYPTDVIAGVVLGAGCAVLARQVRRPGPSADGYLKGTETGRAPLEYTAMKSRSSGVR